MSKLRIRINNKDILKTLPNGFCPGIAHRRVRFGIADDMELMELYPDGTTDEFIGFMDRKTASICSGSTDVVQLECE